MKIAIVGKGMAGLAAAFHLLTLGKKLDIYYSKSGASMAASGLLHKHPAEMGKKAFLADAAFQEVEMIFNELKKENPHLDFATARHIERIAVSEETEKNLSLSSEMTKLARGHYLMAKGYCVDVPLYLNALEAYLTKRGVCFMDQKIAHLDQLAPYDFKLIAAGYGIKNLQSKVKLKFIKGQSLVFDNQQKHKHPLMAKGYLVPFKDKVIVGSTYERFFNGESPDIYTAYTYLSEGLSTYFSPYDELTPKGALSGVRVFHPNFKIPKIICENASTLCITGLGSKGLLYHALLGKVVSEFLRSSGQIDAKYKDFFL